MEWIDSHCHLDMLETSVEETLERSSELGIHQMVTIGTTRKSNNWIAETVTKHEGVFGVLGYHPHYADDFVEEDLEIIERHIIQTPKIVAIGECGFDSYYQKSTIENQRRSFELLMDMAIRLNKPLVVHTRSAEENTMITMEPYLKKGLKCVLHSFTSNDQLAEFGIKYDCYFSFNGISTLKNSENIRQLLKKVPPDRVLLETDSPYLAPHPHRGKKNFPGWVSLVGEFLANYLEISVNDFAAQTCQNTKNFYNLN